MRGSRSAGLSLCSDFLYAGSTAALLSIAKLYPDYWFVTFIALVPFLWRCAGGNRQESIRVSILLALLYVFVTTNFWQTIHILPVATRLIVYISLFLTYGLFVSAVSNRIGFQAVYVAAFWIPIEYCLTFFLKWEPICTLPPDSSLFYIKFGSLFGLIMITFVIVFVNVLIMAICESIVRSARRYNRSVSRRKYLSRFYECIIYCKHQYYSFPTGRGPPFLTASEN